MLGTVKGNTAITGVQFGDEGKGQIVDALASDYDFVVRYNGGANAGHSVIVNGSKHALHLVPSGILHDKTINVVANGVVVDPFAILSEIDELRNAGVEITPENLRVSHRCHLVLPYHKVEDRLLDVAMAEGADSETLLETTGRGIGPAYADKAHRSTAVRMIDLTDTAHLRGLLKQIGRVKTAQLSGLAKLSGSEFVPIDPDEIFEQLTQAAGKLRPHICDTTEVLRDGLGAGQRILFEGANATLLDVDFGTYPFVTSSSCAVPGIRTATGLGDAEIHNSIGVAKLYMSRVGAGPFPTELPDNEAGRIRERAHEFGTTTGRPRRIGALDLVALRHTTRLNATTGLVLTGLAFLHGVSPIRICTGYRVGGTLTDKFPAGWRVLAEAQPVYTEVEGFEESVSGCRSFAELPDSAHQIIGLVEEHTGARIAAVCTGKERDQILER